MVFSHKFWLCSHLMWIPSQSSLNPRGGCEDRLGPLIHPSPAKVVRKVLGGHPVESDHPAFEAVVITIDILDMEDGVFSMDVFIGQNQFKGNFLVIDEAPQRIASIDAQDIVLPQSAAQDLFDCGFGLIGQNCIDHRAMPVPSHQNWNLLAGKSALLRLASTLSGWAGKLTATFEGFKEIGFVRLRDAFKLDRLVGSCSPEEAMTPSKRRGHGDATSGGGLANAKAFLQRRGHLQPAIFFSEKSQWAIGQGVECFSTIGAAIALKAARFAPLLNVSGMTVGALSLCCKPAVDDRYNVLKIVLSSKRLPEKISLFLREVVYKGDKFLKIVSFHAVS